MSAADESTVWSSPVYAALWVELERSRQRRVHILRDARLELSAFAILQSLTLGAEPTLRDLSRDLRLELSTVTRQVAAAVARGYVERFSVGNEPSRRIRATEAGREALAHDITLHADRLSKVFESLEPEADQRLLHELRAFNEAYERQVDRLDPLRISDPHQTL